MRTIDLLSLLAFAASALSASPAWAEVPPVPTGAPSPLAPPSVTATPPPVVTSEPTVTPPPAPPAPPVVARPQPSKNAMPEVPEIADEPMPVWKRPPPQARENRRALFLGMAPEVQQAQRLRQIGLGISIVGWASIFAGGIVYEQTSSNDIQTGFSGLGHVNATLQNTGIGFMAAGGAVAAIGFAIFTTGQWRVTAWHKKRPNDAMPTLSGF
ncbi:MAG TPA: hypothetical protein VIA18_24520 [Polyangia bacterium]|nr:hypothetical protein [Polyangia bacterium]